MGLFGWGRADPARVLRNGTSMRGHIIGIRVSRVRQDPRSRVDEYAVRVAASDGMRIYGVRQQLRPDHAVRLGLPVQLRVAGKAAFIDWATTCGSHGALGDNLFEGWRALKEPPHEGVTDTLLAIDKAQRKGMPARVTIESVSSGAVGATPRDVLDLCLVVRAADVEARNAVLHQHHVPFYARHVCEPGSELPAYVRGGEAGQVDIDWPTAARNFMAIEAARRG